MSDSVRKHRQSQAGFTIAEVMMASVVAMIILMAVAAALTAGIVGNRTIKGNQQATALANKGIEDARDRQFTQLVLSRDAALQASSGYGLSTCAASNPDCPPSGRMFKPAGGGPLEPVESEVPDAACQQVPLPAGLANACPIPWQVTAYDPVLKGTYTKTTVISRSDGKPADENRARRITVTVSYKRDGATFSATSSTVITNSRRGLPEPRFEVEPISGSATVGQGAQFSIAHTISNQGIADTYDIRNLTGPGAWNLRVYRDNGDGLFDPAVDQVLTDTNGNSDPDTGNVTTNAATLIFVTGTIPAGYTLGPSEVTFTVTSGAHATFTQDVTDTVTVGKPFERYYPYNWTDFEQQQNVDTKFNADPLVNLPMRMDTRSPKTASTDPQNPGDILWTDLRSYGVGHPSGVSGLGRPLSVNATSVPGVQSVYTGGNSSPDAAYAAAWDALPVVTARNYGGEWRVQVFVANAGTAACTQNIPLTVYLNRVTSTGTVSNITRIDQTLSMAAAGAFEGGCSFQGFNVGAPLPNFTLNAGERLRVRIVPGGAAGSRPINAPILVAYGVQKDLKNDPQGAASGVTLPTFFEIGTK